MQNLSYLSDMKKQTLDIALIIKLNPRIET